MLRGTVEAQQDGTSSFSMVDKDSFNQVTNSGGRSKRNRAALKDLRIASSDSSNHGRQKRTSGLTSLVWAFAEVFLSRSMWEMLMKRLAESGERLGRVPSRPPEVNAFH